MSEELKVAIEAAKKAAEHATKFLAGSEFEVMRKGDGSPVTQADKECEKIIREVITAKFPDAKFVGEEGGGSRDEDEFWIIDPIDGTKAFARNIPFWSVLIAYYKNDDIQSGVAYNPGLNQLLYADRGSGAFLNDNKVKVSQTKDMKGCYFTFASPKKLLFMDRMLEIVEQAEWSRCIGDAPSFFLLISGKTDLHLESGLDVWDTAPFKVILEEAGGKITDATGTPWTIKTSNIIASNGILHDEAIRVLNQK